MRKLLCIAAVFAAALCTAAMRPPRAAQAGKLEQPQEKHKVIVKLVGRNRHITVSTGANGPVYSVADTTGQVLLANLPLHELQAKDPDAYQQIRSAVARESEPVWAGADLGD